MSKPLLCLDKVSKFYGAAASGVRAVADLSLTVSAGETVALLGSSGCGKTTTLRMIAGFEDVTRGSIHINDRAIHNLPPVKRNVAMAFEGYSLYPPLNVRDNIAFALKSARLSAAEVATRVTEIAEMLQIEDILERYPGSISGGQQQRASLGRALIRYADLHLLDEPMGQLEPQLRALLRGRIKHFVKKRGLSVILVTHDQTEANALADRIAVMEGGELLQYDTPESIRQRPANLFTGSFVGEPPMNVFTAGVTQSSDRLSLTLGDGVVLDYARNTFSPDVCDALLARGTVMLGVRPYAVRIGERGVKAIVAVNQWLGDQSHIAAEFNGGSLISVEHDRVALKPGDRIQVDFQPQDLHIFDPRSGAAIAHGSELAR